MTVNLGSGKFAVGLTGGIGTGKTTIAGIFASLGAGVVDADAASREIMLPGSETFSAVAEKFGKGVIASDGTLDRRHLREIVFSSPEALAFLESVTHPAIMRFMQRKMADLDAPYVIAVVPLLFEKHFDCMVERTLAVDLDESLQISRTAERDRSTADAVRAIMDHQLSRGKRAAMADDIIYNDPDPEVKRASVMMLHRRYLALAEGMKKGPEE